MVLELSKAFPTRFDGTMACGSGALLADLLTGRQPAFDPAPYRLGS